MHFTNCDAGCPQTPLCPHEEHAGVVLPPENDLLLVRREGRPHPIAFSLDENTVLLDGAEGTPVKTAFFPGETVRVWASRAQTRSIPPQAAAAAILKGASNAPLSGRFHAVRFQEEADGAFLLDEENQIVFSLSDKTEVRSAAGDPLPLSSLCAVREAAIWCDVMTLSLPARAWAQRVVVLF